MDLSALLGGAGGGAELEGCGGSVLGAGEVANALLVTMATGKKLVVAAVVADGVMKGAEVVMVTVAAVVVEVGMVFMGLAVGGGDVGSLN